jgi:myo-inositol-1(or 4)-monophosphatase
MMRSPAELEQIAGVAGLAAADIITRSYGFAERVGIKSSPTDIVTQTDLASEQLLRKLLAEATPDAGFVGEEGGATSQASRLQWIIDPLDGTVNFLYGVPVFAVSIAASIDGDVVAGAVIDVLRREVFSAHVGGGARLDGEPISISTCTTLATALVATGFSYRQHIRVAQGAVVAQLVSQARDVRAFGSAALEACWVACGRLDAYYERDIKVWDYSAGILIAREAGALAELPCPENDDLVLVSVPAVFEPLRFIVQARTA